MFPGFANIFGDNRELELQALAALLAIKPKKLKMLHHIVVWGGGETAPGCC